MNFEIENEIQIHNQAYNLTCKAKWLFLDSFISDGFIGVYYFAFAENLAWNCYSPTYILTNDSQYVKDQVSGAPEAFNNRHNPTFLKLWRRKKLYLNITHTPRPIQSHTAPFSLTP